jgi:hypothetical protein
MGIDRKVEQATRTMLGHQDDEITIGPLPMPHIPVPLIYSRDCGPDSLRVALGERAAPDVAGLAPGRVVRALGGDPGRHARRQHVDTALLVRRTGALIFTHVTRAWLRRPEMSGVLASGPELSGLAAIAVVLLGALVLMLVLGLVGLIAIYVLDRLLH